MNSSTKCLGCRSWSKGLQQPLALQVFIGLFVHHVPTGILVFLLEGKGELQLPGRSMKGPREPGLKFSCTYILSCPNSCQETVISPNPTPLYKSPDCKEKTCLSAVRRVKHAGLTQGCPGENFSCSLADCLLFR